MNDRIRLLIISSSEIEGEGLRRLLIDGVFDVIGVRRDVDHRPGTMPAHDAAAPDPGMILLHVPGDDGAELCRRVRTRWPDVTLAVMARECDSVSVAEACRSGADGYISVDTSIACLLDMLKLIASGERLVPAQVVRDLVSIPFAVREREDIQGIGDVKVSDREMEILRELILGEPNKVISRRLNITEATVKVHVKSILRKLQVINRTQAAVWAFSHGLRSSADVADGEAIDHPLSNGAMQPRYS